MACEAGLKPIKRRSQKEVNFEIMQVLAASGRNELSAGGPFCLVTKLKPATPMLCLSPTQAHLSNLLVTQSLA